MTLIVHTCPDHGPFVDHDEMGCPEQVDYDGIACGKAKTPVEYVPVEQLRGAVKAIERLTQFAEALRNTGDDPTPAEIAEDILTLLRVDGKCICDREEGCPCIGRLPT